MDANLSVLSEGSKGELVYGTYPVLKGMGWEERIPMCGIPYHSAANYIEHLTE
jgi:hypothetical protein